jgi:RNA polymerase sigma-70 factor, ECF subfamily
VKNNDSKERNFVTWRRVANEHRRRRQVRIRAMQNIDQMYSQYRSKLLAFIRQQIRDRELAEDILHDVFVKIVARSDSIREPAKLPSWLYQVTRNAIVDRLRSTRPYGELPPEIEAVVEESPAGTRLARCLQPMIDALPETYREAVMLSEIEGAPLKQVAERQRITLSGVKSRIQRARRRLAVMLQDCCRIELSGRGAILDFSPISENGAVCAA